MSMIICDNCGFEWLAGQAVFEDIILDQNSGLKMRYFRCPECGKEYVVDVTDKTLRRMISCFKKMKRKYIRMFNAHESQTRLREYGSKLEGAQEEIIAREKMLKEKWLGGK